MIRSELILNTMHIRRENGKYPKPDSSAPEDQDV